MLVRGREYTNAEPMMGKQHAIMVTRHRRPVQRAASQENPNAARVDMIPVGMLRREVLTAENPRLSMIIPLNVVRPKPLVMIRGWWRTQLTSVWNVYGNVKEKENPSLGIDGCFEGLVPFPFLVNNSRPVFSETLNGIILLLVCQEKSIHRRVRQEDNCNDRPQCGYGSWRP